jgi:hypothetical protein
MGGEARHDRRHELASHANGRCLKRRPNLLEQLQQPSHIWGMPGLGQRLKDLLRRSFDVSGRDAHLQSMQLLRENLSPAQRGQLEVFNYFEVIGGDTGKRYRIHLGHQMNVEVLDKKGNHARTLCFMPRGYLPTGDMVLAQKLALELFETEAVQISNVAVPGITLFDHPPYGFRR